MPDHDGGPLAAVQSLSPGYFPFVMATSIISTGAFLLGPSWLSRVLLVIAAAALGVLIVALVIQLVLFRPGVAAGFRDPDRVFAFFTIAAGINVLGVRLAAAGHPLATAILAGVAAAVWLVLTYVVPASLLLERSRESVLGDVNGTWLLWVVATVSVSLVASTLVPVWPFQTGLLAPFAVGLWCVGLVLYLLLVSLILLRWLTVPLTYEPSLWSVVFPLGMYSVATLAYGKAAHLAFMEPLSRFMLWVAVAAWLAVAAALVVRICGASTRQRSEEVS
jgi:tellurite resistance protein TehA-like permease